MTDPSIQALGIFLTGCGIPLGAVSLIFAFFETAVSPRSRPRYVEMVCWRRPFALYRWLFKGHWKCAVGFWVAVVMYLSAIPLMFL
jgi:hypothetical protein